MTTTRPTFEDLLAWLEASRAQGQVHFDDKQQCWHVLGHPEVSTVLSDPAVFSSDLSVLRPDQDDLALFQRGNFVNMDPPQHRKLRTLVSQAFTPRVVADLEPRIAQLTNQLLDQVDERFDLIDALAYPLPVIVIAELLGIPTSDRGTFRRWADTLFSQEIDPDRSLRDVSEQAMSAVAPTMHEMNAYFLDYIRSRRAGPGSDLTSKLTQAEVDGERLTDEEIVGFVGLLLLAGHITTTATLGNSVVSFQHNPDAVAEVRADPELLPAAIEEVLRVRTPFPRLARITTAETEVAGVPIAAGQVVLPWLTAANRDERVFTEPHRFDVHRRPNPHLAFGHGIHYCLGAPLARLEAQIAIGTIISRFPNMRLVAAPSDLAWRPGMIIRGLTHLPVLLS